MKGLKSLEYRIWALKENKNFESMSKVQNLMRNIRSWIKILKSNVCKP